MVASLNGYPGSAMVDTNPMGITLGPDGNLLFAEEGAPD
jgi:hypothetical protein